MAYIEGTYDPAYPTEIQLILGPPGPYGWVMYAIDELDPLWDRITEDLELEDPVCSCGFTPDPDCVVDHMGRKKVDMCTCNPGEINGMCREHGSPDYRG